MRRIRSLSAAWSPTRQRFSNFGPATATGVAFTLSYPAADLLVQTVTPSQGTCVSGVSDHLHDRQHRQRRHRHGDGGDAGVQSRRHVQRDVDGHRHAARLQHDEQRRRAADRGQRSGHADRGSAGVADAPAQSGRLRQQRRLHDRRHQQRSERRDRRHADQHVHVEHRAVCQLDGLAGIVRAPRRAG